MLWNASSDVEAGRRNTYHIKHLVVSQTLIRGLSFAEAVEFDENCIVSFGLSRSVDSLLCFNEWVEAIDFRSAPPIC